MAVWVGARLGILYIPLSEMIRLPLRPEAVNTTNESSDDIFGRDKRNPYAERFIGSLRRGCLVHIIVFNEASSRHILKGYFKYYEHSRTHLALAKDAPESRAIQPREAGIVVELPQVGGLHHHYERRAA
jgi:hypothetical protein